MEFDGLSRDYLEARLINWYGRRLRRVTFSQSRSHKKCQEKRVYSKKRKELYLWLYGHLCQVSNKPPCWTNWSYLGSSLSRSVPTKLHINEQRRCHKSPNNITPLYDRVINQSIHQNSTINFFVSLEMFIMQWRKTSELR